MVFPNNIYFKNCKEKLSRIYIINEYCDFCTSGASGTSPPTKQHSVVPQFVSTLKRFCNKEIGQNIFQRSFHDHIVRDMDDYVAVWQYIDNNPLKWQLDKYYTEV